MYVFTVTFDLFNTAMLMNKIISLFKKKKVLLLMGHNTHSFTQSHVNLEYL